MSKAKPEKPEGRDVPIEDPQLLKDTFRLLLESESEFPIKVEGTSTLPYTSRIHSVFYDKKEVVIKLARPLPHELMAGAIFRMVFAVEAQRFEGLITFLGREAYLQYRFQFPPYLFHADRRFHKRYSFRPRETAFVIAQHSGIPGLGLAGPLVNVSLSGFAFRVDRVLKLDDGMRIAPNTALFQRDMPFARVRIQDLPRLRLLECRALVVHATEHGSEVILGMRFERLSEGALMALGQSLDLREKMYRGGQPPTHPEGLPTAHPDGIPAPHPEGIPATRLDRPLTSQPAAPASPLRDTLHRAEGPDFLEGEDLTQGIPSDVSMVLRLRRRTVWVVLVMAPGLRRDGIQALLRRNGYHRMDTLDSLSQVKPFCQSDARVGSPHLFVADLALTHRGDAEPLAAVRLIEHQLAEVGDLPLTILSESVDPTLLLAQGERTRFLPYQTTNEARWAGTVDSLLELD